MGASGRVTPTENAVAATTKPATIVGVLGEPTNDVDAQMLTAMEDLLDSWPGTLIVVSHDRYLLERVTDQQYAILDGRLRHVPGGVDEYLRLREEKDSTPLSGDAGTTVEAEDVSALSGAEQRAAQKELSAVERRLEKLAKSIENLHAQMADHDHADYTGLQAHADRLREFDAETAQLEERWLELSELLG